MSTQLSSAALAVITFFVITTLAQSEQPAIWPLPRVYSNGSSALSICNTGFFFSTNIESTILNNALDRFDNYLQNAPPFLRTTTLQNVSSTAAALCSGTITVASSDETLSIKTDESYTLLVGSSAIAITAQTVYGAMYALTTLQQLIRSNGSTNANAINNAPWSIQDSPAYKHRGVMLDTSRNFLSVDTMERVLDGMAMTKLNVLHLHLTDAQSWPFYSTLHPELSEYGAYSQSKVYKPSDLTKLVLYAKNLGIRVIPEFDTPGHSFAINFGVPQVMECVAVQDNVPAMCPEPPCGYLNVQDQAAYSLIMDVYQDAFAIFNDEYFHLGADEVQDACYGSNTTAMYVEWISTMAHDVHSKGGKTPILWAGDVDIKASIGQNGFDVVMQIWSNADDKLTALENGFQVIDSTYTSYYLDCGLGSWLTGGNSWCDPYKTWLNIYNHSLTEGIPQKYWPDILGGEVCAWGESIDGNNLQPRLWPRATAAAERWWRDEPLVMSDLNSAFYRIALQRDWMVYQGIVASPVQPEFCTLYPTYCDYYRDDIMMQMKGEEGAVWRRKLKQYKLEAFAEKFEEHGWNIMRYWKQMTFEQAQEMGFKRGHWNKFQNLVKDMGSWRV